jgi:hypothetical protein
MPTEKHEQTIAVRMSFGELTDCPLPRYVYRFWRNEQGRQKTLSLKGEKAVIAGLPIDISGKLASIRKL